MLDEDDGYAKVGRQQRQHLCERTRPPGGDPDRHDVDARRRQGSARCRWTQAGGGGRWRRGRLDHAAQRLHLGDELLTDALDGDLDAADVGRLRHVVVRPQQERIDGRGGPPRREGAEHDHRQARVGGPQRPKRADAVELRHLHVEDDQVGDDLGQLGQGDAAVRGGTGHLDGRVGRKDVGQDLAHHHGVVDHENTGASHGHASASPSISSLPRTTMLSNGFMMYSFAPA